MAQQLTVSERSDQTLSALRASGHVPAVVYGHGIDTQAIQVDTRAFDQLFARAGYTTLIDLAIGDQIHNVLIREVQFHPIKDIVAHVDFYQVRMDEPVSAEVPLVFTGESPAIKDLGGVFVRNIDALSIEALPKDLPHDIPVDISVLKNFDIVIRVTDLTIPAGVTVQHEVDEVVALVQAPRTEAELDTLSEEVTEDVTTVEGVEKKEPEGETTESDSEPAKPE